MAESNVKSIIKEIFSWALWLGGALLMALVLNNTIIVNAEVISGSMETTIMTDDHVLGLRVVYLFKDPERLDVIVFKNPHKEKPDGDPYVKRIIGLPGETVEIIDGMVYIGGAAEPLDESLYLPGKMYGSFGPYTVPDDAYFVMGDNRNNSMDSREGWFVPRNEILGKIYIDFFPRFKIIK